MSWKFDCAWRVLIISCKLFARDLMLSLSRLVVGSSSAISYVGKKRSDYTQITIIINER